VVEVQVSVWLALVTQRTTARDLRVTVTDGNVGEFWVIAKRCVVAFLLSRDSQRVRNGEDRTLLQGYRAL
jgi:hypothetical protein